MLYSWETDLLPMVQEARWATGPVGAGVEYLTSMGIWSPAHPAHRMSLYLTTISRSPLGPILSQTRAIYNLTPNFFKIIFNIYVHQWLRPISGNWSLYFPTESCIYFSLHTWPYMFHLPPRSHPLFYLIILTPYDKSTDQLITISQLFSSPVTISFLGPNIFITSLLGNTLSY